MNIKEKFPNLTPKQSEAMRIVYRISSTILASVLIIILTIAFVYYANGYRIGKDGEIEVTGTVALRSSPSNSPVYIDGQRDGTTSKTFSSLAENQEYTFEVKRDGYHTWKKSLIAQTEKLTPLHAHLFKNDLEVESKHEIKEELLFIENSLDKKNIFIFTMEENTEPEEELVEETEKDGDTNSESKIETKTDESVKLVTYRMWRYNTNPRFWNPSENPQLILEQKFVSDTDIEPVVSISPSGEFIRLSINGEHTDEDSKDIDFADFDTSQIMTYMVKTNTLVEDISKIELDLHKFVDDYAITWSEDSNYLLLESEEEVLGYNIDSERRTLLLKKDNLDVVWQTDREGYFYHVEDSSNESSDDSSNTEEEYMKILVQELSGSKQEELIEKIYTHNDPTLISGDISEMQNEFENAPDNTRFAGKITELKFVNDPDGIFMTTDLALYWYDIDTEKYILVSNTPSELLSINPNNTKVLFKDINSSLGLFTFDKEEQNHTESIGTITLLEGSEEKPIESVTWHGNSEYIFFSDTQSIRVIDDEGDNNIELSENGDYFVFSPSGDSMFILDALTDEKTLTVSNTLSKYQIH